MKLIGQPLPVRAGVIEFTKCEKKEASYRTHRMETSFVASIGKSLFFMLFRSLQHLSKDVQDEFFVGNEISVRGLFFAPSFSIIDCDSNRSRKMDHRQARSPDLGFKVLGMDWFASSITHWASWFRERRFTLEGRLGR